tara:strand:- start:14 stop:202 length:189 start_codon:yes stop_codon:yes gene_type:complete
MLIENVVADLVVSKSVENMEKSCAYQKCGKTKRGNKKPSSYVEKKGFKDVGDERLELPTSCV